MTVTLPFEKLHVIEYLSKNDGERKIGIVPLVMEGSKLWLVDGSQVVEYNSDEYQLIAVFTDVKKGYEVMRKIRVIEKFKRGAKLTDFEKALLSLAKEEMPENF